MDNLDSALVTMGCKVPLEVDRTKSTASTTSTQPVLLGPLHGRFWGVGPLVSFLASASLGVPGIETWFVAGELCGPLLPS